MQEYSIKQPHICCCILVCAFLHHVRVCQSLASTNILLPIATVSVYQPVYVLCSSSPADISCFRPPALQSTASNVLPCSHTRSCFPMGQSKAGFSLPEECHWHDGLAGWEARPDETRYVACVQIWSAHRISISRRCAHVRVTCVYQARRCACLPVLKMDGEGSKATTEILSS